MSKIHGYPVTTDRSKRVRRDQLAIERRRKINDSEARRQQRRAIANGATASGCSTMVTVALLAGGIALLGVAKKVWP